MVGVGRSYLYGMAGTSRAGGNLKAVCVNCCQPMADLLNKGTAPFNIRGSVASANRFSSHVVRCLLPCGSVSVGHVLASALTCRPNPVLVENADTL